MRGKSDEVQQRDLFRPKLVDFIDFYYKSVLLFNKIDWKYFEVGFQKPCSTVGLPSMPVQSMVGYLLSKRN